MYPRAIFIGAIGALCETSELQRRAFNAAFAEAGLAWEWTRSTYAGLLETPGGAHRIAHFARRQGAEVDSAMLHRRKSEIYHDMLRATGLPLRPGIADVMATARRHGVALGLVTTTSRENVDTLLAALRPSLPADSFAVTVTRDMVAQPKPASDAYLHALEAIGLRAEEAMAIEDTPESAASAVGAGLRCVAFPGAYHRGRRFPPQVTLAGSALVPQSLGLAAAPAA